MAPRTRKRINDNRAFICVKENNQLVVKPVDIFGSVRAIVGEDTSPNQVAQLVHDIMQQKHGCCIRVELCTGGEYLPEFDGYKNWFPGCTTYGFIRNHDTRVVDENHNQIYDDFNNPVYVPMFSGAITREQATVEILDHLDAVLTDPVLRRR